MSKLSLDAIGRRENQNILFYNLRLRGIENSNTRHFNGCNFFAENPETMIEVFATARDDDEISAGPFTRSRNSSIEKAAVAKGPLPLQFIC
ncbi:hypothetical protein [Ruegeria lacuscaerulensis]|uniref:hypothetical protein n=1 Tax=Ruegeria lacuscaerulensis TaxID=55218 RepID=UPI001479F944|nr:hypothetical protein [Ruegeria lacuscaerulensis]